MKQLVLSGINLFTGGTLEIYKKIIEELGSRGYDAKYEITAFVHKKSLFDGIACNVSYIEIPDGRSYLKRMYYENTYFYNWSKRRSIDVWVAMHDLSPRVVARKRYTYYHTPQIFYNMPIKKAVLDPRCFLRSKFYRYFVARNMWDVDGVIVQANWIKDRFGKMFRMNRIIVARPEESCGSVETANVPGDTVIFFYPSFPRVFKNFEVICKACKYLNYKGYRYKVILTIKGNENRYSKWLYKTYGKIDNIRWVGLQDRDKVEELYQKSSVLIFPSTLETWGLPITEWGKYGKPMILADIPYAHETAMHEKNKSFFNADNSMELALLMAKHIKGKKIPDWNEDIDAWEKRDEWGTLLETMLR